MDAQSIPPISAHTASYPGECDTATIQEGVVPVNDVNPRLIPAQATRDLTKPLDAYSVEAEATARLPDVLLANGQWVTDFSDDANFALRMETMPIEEATTIKELINQFPNEYPMPGMAVTAQEIRRGLSALRRQKELTTSDKEVLHRFEEELDKLESKSPAYPYRQSLTLCYRFLHYKSLLDYQEQVRAFFPGGLGEFDIHQNREILTNKFMVEGVKRLSFYQPGMTLEDLEALPWDSLLDKTKKDFESALFNYYYSATLHRKSGEDDSSGFHALRSDIPLIPCCQSLGVDFFNKTVSLPLWLVGFSLAESTRADGYDMGCSEFFDHDLFHLAIKLMRFFQSPDDHQIVANWICQLYQHRDQIPCTQFAAIELCIFHVFHEQGQACEKIMAVLESAINENSKYKIDYKDLPRSYADVTVEDVRQACHWLLAFPVNNYSDSEFQEQLDKVNAQFNWDTDPYDIKFTVEKQADPVLEAIRESIRDNRVLMKTIQLQPRRLIHVLNLYENNRWSSGPSQAINLKRLLDVPRQYQEEACWLYCYFMAKDKGMAADLVQQACESLLHIKANAQTLDLLSKRGVEAFANECLRRHPEYNGNPALMHIAFNGLTGCTHGKYTSIYNDIFLEDYSDFWPTQDFSAEKEVMDYPVGYMGKFENNQFSLWWFSHNDYNNADAVQLYNNKEKEGYIKGNLFIKPRHL